MKWITPKTNWVATDHLNISDWARIVNNVNYATDLAIVCGADVEFPNIYWRKTIKQYPYASEWNAIENVLDDIANAYSLNIGEKHIFYPNQPTLDFNELNRIEDACQRIYELLKDVSVERRFLYRMGQYKYLSVDDNPVKAGNIPLLAFRLGNYKGIKL